MSFLLISTNQWLMNFGTPAISRFGPFSPPRRCLSSSLDIFWTISSGQTEGSRVRPPVFSYVLLGQISDEFQNWPEKIQIAYSNLQIIEQTVNVSEMCDLHTSMSRLGDHEVSLKSLKFLGTYFPCEVKTTKNPLKHDGTGRLPLFFLGFGFNKSSDFSLVKLSF